MYLVIAFMLGFIPTAIIGALFQLGTLPLLVLFMVFTGLIHSQLTKEDHNG